MAKEQKVPAALDWKGARGETWRAQLNGIEGMLRAVDDPLIDALGLDAPYRIADIGCGGGGTSLAIFRRAPRGSAVHGFDVSPALVDVARARLPPDERAVAFQVADVATAEPPEPPYDRMVSRFGIMFFDEPQQAFSRLRHWLAPSGRFAFATWGAAAENPWSETVRDAVAEVVEIPAPIPDSPGPFRYADSEQLMTLLRGAGFGELEVRDFRAALPMGGGLGAEAAAEFALAAFSSFGALLADAGEVARAHAREALVTRFSRHEKGGVVLLDAFVRIFTGTNP
jgi:SAM-dependent methyltransferase